MERFNRDHAYRGRVVTLGSVRAEFHRRIKIDRCCPGRNDRRDTGTGNENIRVDSSVM